MEGMQSMDRERMSWVVGLMLCRGIDRMERMRRRRFYGGRKKMEKGDGDGPSDPWRRPSSRVTAESGELEEMPRLDRSHQSRPWRSFLQAGWEGQLS